MVYKISDAVKMIDKGDSITFEENSNGEIKSYEVKGAGVVFVQLIDGERDLDQILEECVNIFGPSVETYTLARDLESFIGELAFEGLIKVVDNSYAESPEK